jgi:hypothetical protein
MGQSPSEEIADNIDWKQKYNELYAKYSQLVVTPSNAESKISDQAIDKFVASLLADPALNIRPLPDIIEGALYRNIFKIILHSLAHTTDAVSLTIMDHKIRIIVEPPENA